MKEPNIYHIDLYENSLLEQEFLMITNGEPVSLAGKSAKLEVYSAGNPTPILSCTEANDRIMIDDAEGKITLTISSSTELTQGGLYRYKLYLIDGAEQTLEFAGNFRIHLNSQTVY